MPGKREASSVLVLMECEPPWAWLPPQCPQGATTERFGLSFLPLLLSQG